MIGRLRILVTLLCVFLVVSCPLHAIAQDFGTVYVTQPGDSLRDLSLFFGVDPIQIADTTEIDETLWMSLGNSMVVPQRIGHSAAPSTYVVERGDTVFRIATRFNIPPEALVDANNIPWADRIYIGQILTIPSQDYRVRSLNDRIVDSAAPLPSDEIPSPSVVEGKQIIVDLSQQQTYAFENGVLLRHFLSSTGLPHTPTVTGDFAIYVKYDAQRMTGPGYDLPGVPWVMYFYRDYALHGAYWHNNFGNPISHGCVNLRIPEAEWLYQWAPVGTPVQVIP